MNAERGIWRGKIKDEMHAEHNGEWLEGDLLCAVYLDGTRDHSITSRESNVVECYLVDTSTLGEYVGLTDKNGKMIFEGDILQANEYKFVVKFGKCGGIKNVNHEVGYIGFYVLPIGKDAKLSIESGIRTDILYWLNAYDVAVIGNIHDDHELIRGDGND